MTGKRRGNGEGSIYQLPNGRWRGSVFLGYRQGKPHRKYVTRRTRAEVAAELRRLLEAQQHGQLATTGGMTVGEWFAVYLDQVAKPGLRPRTFDRYSSDIAGHILPAIGHHRLDKLRPAHLAALYNAKAAEGLSPASLRHIHAVIDPRNDYREFKKLLARAGLPSVRLHDLRHTAASLLLAQGVPARVVMEILGHSAIALTMNTYSHVAPEVSREAAERMARMLWNHGDEDQADDDGERGDG